MSASWSSWSEAMNRPLPRLYDRYSRRLLNYFHRMLWSDREKAQDFLQDLFTKLATRPQSYDAARPFQTWLFSVANNMCKNAYRHEAVVREAAIHLRNGVDRVEATGGIECGSRTVSGSIGRGIG